MHIQKLEDGSILLTAPVMIPGVPDCDYPRGEPPLTKDEVKYFAKSYEDYQLVDSEHEITKTGRSRGHKRESSILESDKRVELYDGSTEVYPTGTWMMTSHVTDPEAIRNAEDGLYTGYSPAVRSRATADKYLAALKEGRYDEAEALKSFSNAGLIKDIPDPVVFSVSLVRKPCQTGSKICKIKENGEKMSDDSKILDKIRKILGDADTEEVEALKSQVDSLEKQMEEMKQGNDEALKSMKDEIIGSFKDSLKEFADKSEEDDDEDEPEDEDKGSKPEKGEDEKPDPDDEEEPEDEDKGSKQGKNHNNKADKSQEDLDTYEFLGRHPDGTRKQY